uniref:NADH:ubiquinone reductase (H(+)-translocating) n=1 Tax=Pomphorhynchus bulbocolli TaxID=317556 RepID=A0A806H225_9BILA|nr:NADH dehydrogenase subunit 5 [Pomphorhynchus bulbocolli]AFJ54191.1 NADH dehydrogenase subunit 5 [Pomphorhynchus bulbocolli]
MAGVGLLVVSMGVVVMMLISGIVMAEVGLSLSLGGLFNLSLGVQDLGSSLCFGGLINVMMGVVVVVFILVMVFSMVYMVNDVSVNVFLSYVVGFVMGMIILVSAYGSYLSVLGWEVLGVVSFVLIGYYATRVAWGSALVTVLINRVGDVLFILFITSLVGYGSVLGGGLSFSVMVVVGAAVVGMVVTKSSQFPCSGWLPLAMAAPTPISALVHSSTLVVAGLVMAVYMWSTVSGVYIVGVLCVVLGGLTLVGSSGSILWEMDFKKVVALSTSIHLAVMVLMLVVCGCGLMVSHMSLHAMFKSLLFVSVGLIILMQSHDQDYRGLLGGSGGFSGVTGLVLLSSVWSLVGLMGFSGWVSKDILIEGLYACDIGLFGVIMGVGALSCSLTYCWKLISVVCGSGVVGSSVLVDWVMGSGLKVTLLLMGVLSVCFGVLIEGMMDFSGVMGVLGLIEKYLYWLLAIVVYIVWANSFVGASSSGSNMFYLQDLYQRVLGWVVVMVLNYCSVVESALGSVVVEGLVSGVGCSAEVVVSGLKVVDMWSLFVGVVVWSGLLLMLY